MDLSKLSEWIKLSPKYLFPISLVTGFSLFVSVDILEIFGVSSLVAQIRPYLGIVFLFSTALLITNLFTSLYSFTHNKYQATKNLKTWQKRLHSLTDDEKEILKYFITNQTRSQYLPLESGVVNGLEHENIIYRASNLGRYNEWAYNIQPWAWEYLNNHRELLELNQKEIPNIENRYHRSRR